MQKIDRKTQEALIQIPKEINKLSKIIAIIGNHLFENETKKLKQKQRDFEKIVACTNADPATYYIKDAPKIYERLVNKRIAVLGRLPEEFKKILSNDSCEQEKEYLLKVSGTQMKLFDNKNKTPINEHAEAKQFLKHASIYVEKLEPKKEYVAVAYR